MDQLTQLDKLHCSFRRWVGSRIFLPGSFRYLKFTAGFCGFLFPVKKNNKKKKSYTDFWKIQVLGFPGFGWAEESGRKDSDEENAASFLLFWSFLVLLNSKVVFLSEPHINDWFINHSQIWANYGNMQHQSVNFPNKKVVFLKSWCHPQIIQPYGGFLKWWYPTTMGFPTKMIILGCFGGTTI